MRISFFDLAIVIQLISVIHCIDIYVSSVHGSDYNDGITRPVNTLLKSINIIRDIRKQNSHTSTHFNVYVGYGIYSPIELTYMDSNITFIGDGNETIISGGYAINTQWTKQSNNNIWTTSINLPSNYSKIYNNNTMNFPKQLWYKDNRKTKINTDILYWTSILNPSNLNDEINKWGLVYKKGDINASWNLYAPGVVIFVFHQWTVSLHQVKYHNFNNQTILFEQPSDFPLGQFIKASQKRWYIEGIPEMILTEYSGEWNIKFDEINNPKNIIVSYAPLQNESFPPKDNNILYIENPFVFTPLVSMIGTWQHKIENIIFDSFSFKYLGYICPLKPQKCDGDNAAFLGNSQIPGAITMQITQNITIKNCIINHIGSFGIMMKNNAPKTNILYSNFTDIGSGAVYIGWSSNNTLISDNYIINGGFIFRHGAGIGGGGATNITIQHNEISQLLGNGIDIDGGPNSPYLIINKNHIHHNGKSDKYGISDYGSFHIGLMNQSCCTTRITNNKLHDIISVVYGGEGLYLDWGSSDVFVYGNLVYNIAGYTLHWNYENSVPAPPHKYPVPPIIIENNILIVSGSGQSSCDGGMYIPNTTFNEGINWGSGPKPYIGNGIFMNNINYMINVNGTQLFTKNEQDSWFSNSTFDYNVYYSRISKDVYFPGSNAYGTQITLNEWQSNVKQDIHSVVMDPMFVDVDNCNFELKSDSPVFKYINFKPLNISDVGPRC